MADPGMGADVGAAVGPPPPLLAATMAAVGLRLLPLITVAVIIGRAVVVPNKRRWQCMRGA